MTNIIVATNHREQQDIIFRLLRTLKDFSDPSIIVVQSGVNKIDVYHEVDGRRYIEVSYRVLIVPISMSLDTLKGFSSNTNINISKLLERIDSMKTEAIEFVNVSKIPSPMAAKQKEALTNATKYLFE